MESKKPSTRPSSRRQEPDIASPSDMLTPSELRQLEQKQRDDFAYLKKVFPGLKVE